MKKRVCSLLLALCLLTGSASALTVEQTREILSANYIDDIPEEILAQPTIEAILDALGDPYTAYYNEEEYAAFLDSMEDTQLVGIGINSYYLPIGILLNQVAPDSPASEAGLKPGDCIVAVDGHDTRGAATADIDRWIRGDEGTQVTLTVLREEETFQVTVTRREVVFPTVILDKIENRVAWITCSAFGPTTFQHFFDIITTYDDEVDQWVVDLRDNGGGNVYSAVCSASCFAGWDSGVYLRDGAGLYYPFLSSPHVLYQLGYDAEMVSAFDSNGYLTLDPVYVLTNEYTASAAELFCASIRDSGAGLIIGGRTYGKGVAQTMYSAGYTEKWMGDWFDNGGALKITTERAYSLAGATYDKVGILPHLLIDSNLADEAAAVLTAPVAEGEDALLIWDLNSSSLLTGSVVLPLEMCQAPENAAAVEQILSALPATALCLVRLHGALSGATPEQAAALCGVAWETRMFSDTEQSAFSVEIDTLGVYGIVSGAGDGAFRPDGVLDRASLCALLVKAMNYPLSWGTGAFADVPQDAWYAPYVNTLYELGIVNGYSDGLFHPEDPMDHEQFTAILGRTARWLDMDYYEMLRHNGIWGDLLPSPETLAETYPSYSAWSRELVWLCDGRLSWDELAQVDPLAPTTREEAAAAIFNLLYTSGALPV